MNKILVAVIITITAFSCKKSGSGGDTGPQPVNDTAFNGRGGIYFLGSADAPINISAYSNPDLAGTVVRFRWENLETAPGVFNWAYIDAELAKAKAAGKKICLQSLGYPQWVVNSLGANSYKYIDRNSYHSTYLDTLNDVITWDHIYLERVKNLISNLANRYAADTTISYCNLVSGQISRGMPDSVVTPSGMQPYWTQFAYNADTVFERMKPVLDLYMQQFPHTPLWNSIDYVSFEGNASGRANNYLASLYVSYGLSKYPNRFGCWREDLSACNPQPSVPSGSQWNIMQQHTTRTGAQMLWSVQDGPVRMNRCGISPNSKQNVLDSSINNGLRLGMRYFEIYAADITDVSLGDNIAQYNNILKAKYKY